MCFKVGMGKEKTDKGPLLQIKSNTQTKTPLLIYAQ